MPMVLLKREDGFAVILGAVLREGSESLPMDIELPLDGDDVVEGRRVAEWPAGLHDLPEEPSVHRVS